MAMIQTHLVQGKKNMPKQLKDILNGVKKSTTTPAKLGDDPGVDYAPKAGDERKFVASHSVEKHEDRVGNGNDVYQGTNVKYSLDTSQNKLMGKKKEQSEKDEFAPVKESRDWTKDQHIDYHKGRHERAVATLMSRPKAHQGVGDAHNIEYDSRKALKKLGVTVNKPNHPAVIESKKSEDAKCNESAKGVNCPVHGMAECMSARKINEKERVDEVLTKKTSAGEIISDFMHSKDKRFAGKSKEERKRMALGAYYSMHPEKKKKTNENTESFAEPLLGGMPDTSGASGGGSLGGATGVLTQSHESEEAIDMVKTELRALANKAMHLVMAMPEGMHIEPWVQAKLAQAKEMVSAVHDYMIYGDHQEEDEQTAPGETAMTFPGMNVDAAGMNV